MGDEVCGPAFVDISNGVAHSTAECPIFQVHAMTQGIACRGPMKGFVRCESCGEKPFTSCGADCECVTEAAEALES